MKKISKKLALATQTVRVLADADLDRVAGAGGDGAVPTTTVLHHSVAANATGCRVTGGVHTAPCRYTTV